MNHSARPVGRPRAHSSPVQPALLARGLRLLPLWLWLLFALLQPAGLRLQGQEYSSISLQLPAARVGHTFTLRQQMPDSGLYFSRPVENGGVAYSSMDEYGNPILTQNSYLEATGEIHLFGNYYLVDETTGETTALNLLGTPSFNRTSFIMTPWYSNGEVSSNFYLTLPEARASHVLSLFTQGASYSINNGAPVYYMAQGTQQSNWQPYLASYGFFDAWISSNPGGPYLVVDHTTNEQSNTHALEERNFTGNETYWGVMSSGYPLKLVRIWLPQSELNHAFTLMTSEQSVTWFATPKIESGFDDDGVWHTNQPCVTASIGGGLGFWLSRDLDDVRYTGVMEANDRRIDAASYFPPYVPPQDPPPNDPPPQDPPPYTPNYQTVSFAVGENHWGHTIFIQQGDGSYVYPAPDWSSQGSQTATDSYGNVYYSYSYVQYSAVVDVNLGSYAAGDDQGHTNFMDGYNPPSPPNDPPPNDPPANYTMSVVVGENHWNDTVTFWTVSGTYTGYPDWSTAGFMAAYDANGVEYYRYNYVTYVAVANEPFDSYSWQAGGIINGSLLDGYNPPDPSIYDYYSFTVGENHWGETIFVYLSDSTVLTATRTPNSDAYMAAYDYLGIEYYRYNYATYTARYIPSVASVSGVGDSSGHTTLMNYNPPPPPEPPGDPGPGGGDPGGGGGDPGSGGQPDMQTVTALVGSDFFGETILVYYGTQVATLSPDLNTYGAQIAYDSTGQEYYRYEWYTYTAYIDVSQGYHIVSSSGATSFFTPFNPPTDPTLPVPLSIMIAASRCEHDLEVHTSNGGIYPVYKNQMEGFWSNDQRGKSWFTSYYYFTGASETRAGQNWWVVDTDAGDQSPPNQHDLSNWQSPDAGLDSDHDSLVDWYEYLIDTRADLIDTDGDGMPDAWEIAHGLNPTDPSDATQDFDHDGRTNLQEYQDGSNPNVGRTEAIILQISSSRGTHDLEVVTESGEHYELRNVTAAGAVVDGQWVSSGYFTADSYMQIGQDWWVNDLTAGESGPVNITNLTTWSVTPQSSSGEGDDDEGGESGGEAPPVMRIFTSHRAREVSFSAWSGPVFPTIEMLEGPDYYVKRSYSPPSPGPASDNFNSDVDLRGGTYEHDDPRDQFPPSPGGETWVIVPAGTEGAEFRSATINHIPAAGAPIDEVSGASYHAENDYMGTYKGEQTQDVPFGPFSLETANNTAAGVSYGGRANFPPQTSGEGWQASGMEGPKSYVVSSFAAASSGTAVNPEGGGSGHYSSSTAGMSFKEVRLESNTYVLEPVTRSFAVISETQATDLPSAPVTYLAVGTVTLIIDEGKVSNRAEVAGDVPEGVVIVGGTIRLTPPAPTSNQFKSLRIVEMEIKINETVSPNDDFVAVSGGTDPDLSTELSLTLGTLSIGMETLSYTAELSMKGTDGDIKFESPTVALVPGTPTKIKMWGISHSSAKDSSVIQIKVKSGNTEVIHEKKVTVYEGATIEYSGIFGAPVMSVPEGWRPQILYGDDPAVIAADSSDYSSKISFTAGDNLGGVRLRSHSPAPKTTVQKVKANHPDVELPDVELPKQSAEVWFLQGQFQPGSVAFDLTTGRMKRDPVATKEQILLALLELRGTRPVIGFQPLNDTPQIVFKGYPNAPLPIIASCSGVLGNWMLNNSPVGSIELLGPPVIPAHRPATPPGDPDSIAGFLEGQSAAQATYEHKQYRAVKKAGTVNSFGAKGLLGYQELHGEYKLTFGCTFEYFNGWTLTGKVNDGKFSSP